MSPLHTVTNVSEYVPGAVTSLAVKLTPKFGPVAVPVRVGIIGLTKVHEIVLAEHGTLGLEKT